MVSNYPATPSLTQTWKDYLRRNEEGKFSQVICEKPILNSAFGRIVVERVRLASLLIPNSLESLLYSNPDFRYYSHIVKLADYSAKLSGCQASFTLFACPDKYLLPTLSSFSGERGIEASKNMIINLDENTARKILLYNTVDGLLDTRTLYNQSRVYYLNPRLQGHSILVRTNNNAITLNDQCNIIQPDIPCNNGIMHLTSSLLLPDMSLLLNTY